MKPFVQALLFGIFLIGCTDQTDNSNKKDETTRQSNGVTKIGNYEYWHHRKTVGIKPYPGILMVYHYRITKGGKVLANTFGGSPAGAVFPSNENAQKDPQALIEGIRLMSVGDSLTIKLPAANQPPDSSYYYDIVLVNLFEK
jgi:hypothetical protein